MSEQQIHRGKEALGLERFCDTSVVPVESVCLLERRTERV
jgi:hypothetical protein